MASEEPAKEVLDNQVKTADSQVNTPDNQVKTPDNQVKTSDNQMKTVNGFLMGGLTVPEPTFLPVVCEEEEAGQFNDAKDEEEEEGDEGYSQSMQTELSQSQQPLSQSHMSQSVAQSSLSVNMSVSTRIQDSTQLSAMYNKWQRMQQSFGNSQMSNSVAPSSVYSSRTNINDSQSVAMTTQSESMQNTQSIQTMKSTKRPDSSSRASESQALNTKKNGYGSIKPGQEPSPFNRNNNLLPGGGGKSRKSRRGWAESIRNLRYASMSVSMLAKPSTDRNASSFLAGWNVSNLIQGTTILGIPYAVAQGGWAALVSIIVLGIVTCYTGRLLVECMYETSKKTGVKRRLRVDYPEIAEAALGKKGHIAMNIIQNSVMFGGSVMYIIILGTVWADVAPVMSLKQWAAINCCITLPTLFITKMSIVSWFSMTSVFSIMALTVVLLVYCFTQLPLWNISNIPAFNIQTFPVGYGIIMFSYCAHAVIPSIEGSMKNPQAAGTMINTSFGIATATKFMIGFLLVLRFGTATAEVVTVNLTQDHVFSKISSFLVIGNVLLAMPLEMFVVSASYDEVMLKYFPKFNKQSGKYFIWLLISRPLLLGLSLLAAVTVPHFGLLMGVVGSLSGTCLTFLFPCYCHLKLRWNELSRLQVAVDVSVMVVGVVGGLLGLCFSMKGLITG